MRKNSSPSSRPLVSFIIQTKNEQRTIGKVLHALAMQTCQDFEIINVDDHSRDRTLAIIQSFAKQLTIKSYPLKSLFNHSASLNLGAAKAQGRYLCILVGHALPITDTWLADGLKHLADPKVAAVTGFMSGLPLGYFSRSLSRLFFLPHQRRLQPCTPQMTNTNALLRRKLWQAYPFDESLPGCEDYDWASEMIARGYRVVKDPRFSVFHSHLVLGQRTNLLQRWQGYQTTVNLINARQRPTKKKTSILTSARQKKAKMLE